MTKNEWVKETAARCGKSQKDVLAVLDAALGVIADTINDKDDVRIPDFGVFKPHTRPASTRKVFGQVLEIEEKDTVVFKPYEKFPFFGRR